MSIQKTNTVRLITLIPQPMSDWLQERAEKGHCSVAELVRRAIEVRMTETGANRHCWDHEDLDKKRPTVND